MEEAHRTSQTYGNGSSMSARQVADSIPVQDHIEAPRSSSSAAKPRTQGYAGSISLDSLTSNLPSVYASKALPLSIPAILKQNVPGFKARNARMAQLQQQSSSRSNGADDRHAAIKGSQKHLGRRKQRRWENAHFHGNQHIFPPRPSDYSPAQLSSAPIFPSPPPSKFFPYKPSTDPIADPNARLPPTFDDTVTSSEHGRFSLPIKGLKRNTRRIVTEGGIGAEIVYAVDTELRAWLEGTDVWLSPGTEAHNAYVLNSGKRCICEVETDHGRMQAINQFAKQPHSLVWQSEDSFTRFLVHAIARYYRIVSFTKTDPTTGFHLIWLLRPNMAPRVATESVQKPKSGFETPPTTASEWEVSSSGNLTTSASELDSVASGSGVDVLSSSEDMSSHDGDTEAEEEEARFEQDDGEGNVTITTLDTEDAVILTRGSAPPGSSESRRRQPRRSSMRPILGRALSDIDSGAEVDDEREGDEAEAEAEDLRESLADLCIQHQNASSRQERNSRGHPSSSRQAHISGRVADDSRSRSASPVRHTRRTSAVQPTRKSSKNTTKGWRMPEKSFSEWVLVG